MHSTWFGDVEGGRGRKAEGDLDALAERLNSLPAGTDSIIRPDWKIAVECGAAKDRADYLAKLRELCIHISRERVAAAFREKDAEIIQMVLVLEAMDQAIGQLTERLADWYRTLHPRAAWKFQPGDARKVLARIGEDAGGPMKEILAEILQLRENRTRLAREIGDRASGVLPNGSALVGGLVAARLMALAGGLAPLSRLPASRIQVLGSRGALFSHLARGTPPPRHGIIYQHSRVHNAPKAVRGRVARVLAGRLAIAARLDLYRGTLVPEFTADADRRITAAGGHQ